ncbi:MAG: hypothetical protein ACTSRZ_15670 [Promethearchaeota archaeon]
MVNLEDLENIINNKNKIILIGEPTIIDFFLSYINLSGIKPFSIISLFSLLNKDSLNYPNYKDLGFDYLYTRINRERYCWLHFNISLSDVDEWFLKLDSIKLMIFLIIEGNNLDIFKMFDELKYFYKKRQKIIPFWIFIVKNKLEDIREELFSIEIKFLKSKILEAKKSNFPFDIKIEYLNFKEELIKEEIKDFRNQLFGKITNYLQQNKLPEELEEIFIKKYLNFIDELYNFYMENKSVVNKIYMEIARFERKTKEAINISIMDKIDFINMLKLDLKHKIEIVDLFENRDYPNIIYGNLMDPKINEFLDKSKDKILILADWFPDSSIGINKEYFLVKQMLIRYEEHNMANFLHHVISKTFKLIISLSRILGIFILNKDGNLLAEAGFNYERLMANNKELLNDIINKSNFCSKIWIAYTAIPKTKNSYPSISLVNYKIYYFYGDFNTIVFLNKNEDLDEFCIQKFIEFTSKITKVFHESNFNANSLNEQMMDLLNTIFISIFPIKYLIELDIDHMKHIMNKEEIKKYTNQISKIEYNILCKMVTDFSYLNSKDENNYKNGYNNKNEEESDISNTFYTNENDELGIITPLDIILKYNYLIKRPPSEIYPSIIDLINRDILKVKQFNDSKIYKENYKFRLYKINIEEDEKMVDERKIIKYNNNPTPIKYPPTMSSKDENYIQDPTDQGRKLLKKEFSNLNNSNTIDTNVILNSRNKFFDEIDNIIKNFSEKKTKKLNNNEEMNEEL